MLSNLNPLLNYRVACPFTLIDMVSLNIQFHAIEYILKFLLFLIISRNMQNFDITFNNIL